MATLVKHSFADVGGLSHLVEAATALSELALPLSKRSSSSQSASVISDDDDHVRAVVQRHVASSSSSSNIIKAAGISASSSADSKAKKREIFPQRLHEILADPSLSDIITWLPHGRSFVIIRPDLFCEQVLPKFLPPVDSRGSTKYPSFTRKLNRWGFRQATRGADTGAFHHPFFCRDQPELCLQMVCQKSRDRQASTSSSNSTGSAGDGGRRNLPPKKRVFANTSAAATTTPPSTKSTPSIKKQQKQLANVIPSVQKNTVVKQQKVPPSAVSAAARVVPAETNAATVAADQAPATTTSAPTPSATGLLPFISTDTKFVKSVLHQRDATEILRAAKSQLYEAYQKALTAEQGQH